MKPLILVSAISLSTFWRGAYGFPGHFADQIDVDAAASKARAHKLAGVLHESGRKRLLFDPMTTPIEVTGEHEFIPPDFSNGDQRGPCPGLNALANHGYIRRDGITSLVELASTMNEVWGMGLDLGLILTVMGTVFVGDPLSLDPGFSIGDASSGAQNILGNLIGLLGTPRGLTGSHNIIEGDSSLTRADLYVTGDASSLNMDQFEVFYNMSADEGNYSFGVFAERAAQRFQETVATNPDFYYGPFTGMVARNAGYFFASRLFANYSSENPEGLLNKQTLKSIFAVDGQDGNLTYTKGWERIPANWYRTPVDYGLLQLNLDMINLISKYPELGSIGGNTGSVNSFTGVDLGNVTGGLLNAQTMLEGNNLLCFVFEVVKTAAPNSLSTIFSIIDAPLKLITDSLGSALLNLSCPAFGDLLVGGQRFDDGIKGMFPGASKSGSAI